MKPSRLLEVLEAWVGEPGDVDAGAAVDAALKLWRHVAPLRERFGCPVCGALPHRSFPYVRGFRYTSGADAGRRAVQEAVQCQACDEYQAAEVSLMELILPDYVEPPPEEAPHETRPR